MRLHGTYKGCTSEENAQYYMAVQQPDNSFHACSDLALGPEGLKVLMEIQGLDNWVIIRQYTSREAIVYKWTGLYDKWMAVS